MPSILKIEKYFNDENVKTAKAVHFIDDIYDILKTMPGLEKF